MEAEPKGIERIPTTVTDRMAIVLDGYFSETDVIPDSQAAFVRRIVETVGGLPNNAEMQTLGDEGNGYNANVDRALMNLTSYSRVKKGYVVPEGGLLEKILREKEGLEDEETRQALQELGTQLARQTTKD